MKSSLVSVEPLLSIDNFFKKLSECQIRDVIIRGVLLPEPSSPAYPRALFWVSTSVFSHRQILVRAGETIGISLPWAPKRDTFTRASPGCSSREVPPLGRSRRLVLHHGVYPSQGKPGEIPVTQIACPASHSVPLR